MLWAFGGCWALLAVGYFIAQAVSAGRARARLWADLEGFLADSAWLNEVEDIVRNWDPEMDDEQS